jgi:5-epi-alpha-selinene synthase
VRVVSGSSDEWVVSHAQIGALESLSMLEQQCASNVCTEPGRFNQPADDCLQLFCPFEAGLNPHVDAVQEASLEWCLRFGIVSEGKALAHLAKSKVGWLVARAFFQGAREPLQIASDWTHLFCLLDDRAEKFTCTVELSGFLSALSESFESGHSTLPGEPFADALLDLRARMLAASSPSWLAGFGERLKEICEGFLWESLNVSRGLQPTVENYVAVRKFTVGLFPQFHLAALTDAIDLPSEVYEHPTIRRLMVAASNCVGWTNDLCTYEKELEQGDRHNLVLVLMRQEGLAVHEAARRAARMHDEEVMTFLRVERALPSFGRHDVAVSRFVGILRSWVRGHLEWAQETGRYRPSIERAAQSSGTWARAALLEAPDRAA